MDPVPTGYLIHVDPETGTVYIDVVADDLTPATPLTIEARAIERPSPPDMTKTGGAADLT